MIGFLQKLAARPQDKTIRIGKVVFAMIYLVTIYYNLIYQGDALETSYFGQTVSNTSLEYVKYVLLAIGFFPLLTGIFDLNLLKSNHTKYLQMVFAVYLMYLASSIVTTPTLDSDTLFMLLWVLIFFIGLTGKAITKQGLRAKQKITKIRV